MFESKDQLTEEEIQYGLKQIIRNGGQYSLHRFAFIQEVGEVEEEVVLMS